MTSIKRTYELLDLIATHASNISLPGPTAPEAQLMSRQFVAFALASRKCLTDEFLRFDVEDHLLPTEHRQTLTSVNQLLESANNLVLTVQVDPAAHQWNNFSYLDSAGHQVRNGIEMLYRLPGKIRLPIPDWPGNTTM